MMAVQARYGELALEFVRVFANYHLETDNAVGF